MPAQLSDGPLDTSQSYLQATALSALLDCAPDLASIPNIPFPLLAVNVSHQPHLLHLIYCACSIVGFSISPQMQTTQELSS